MMKKLLLLVGLVVFSFSAKSEEYFCESKKNGNVYKSPVGCFNNITLTEEEFLSKSDKLIEYTPTTFVLFHSLSLFYPLFVIFLFPTEVCFIFPIVPFVLVPFNLFTAVIGHRLIFYAVLL